MKELHIDIGHRDDNPVDWPKVLVALSKFGWFRAKAIESNFAQISVRLPTNATPKMVDQALQDVDPRMLVGIHEQGDCPHAMCNT